MKLVFRADAGMNIGAGHVMRCAAIAEAAMNRGIDTELVGTIYDIPWLVEKVNNGLFTNFSSPSLAQRNSGDILVIDSYKIDHQNSFVQRNAWSKTISLVDRETPFYDADIYVGFLDNLDWAYADKVSPSKIHYGIEFNPVRKLLREKSELKRIDGNTPEILVIGGGTDFSGFAQKIVKVLSTTNAPFRCNVVGYFDSSLADSRFNPIAYGESYDKALLNSDLVLTSAGSTIWELMTLKVPFGVVCLTTNQIGNFNYLKKYHLAQPIGDLSETNDPIMDENAIVELISNSNLRVLFQRKLCEIDVGNGADLICDLILQNLA